MLTRIPRVGTILKYEPSTFTKPIFYKLARKSLKGKIGHVVELDRNMEETIFHTSIILMFGDCDFNSFLTEVPKNELPIRIKYR